MTVQCRITPVDTLAQKTGKWEAKGATDPQQVKIQLSKHCKFLDSNTARLFFFSFAVLGLELRAFTLSHSISPIFVKGFSR
jgi:hypothetical protein